jgi:glycerate kinase
VGNPLLGANGATQVFAAQKGATAEQMKLLEAALTKLADVVQRDFGVDHRAQAGAGAAGGLGFALMSFCAAKVRPGFDVVAELIGVEAAVQNADVVITGEGRLDAQTLNGKAPAGIARLARRYGKRTHAIVGEYEDLPALRELFTSINALTGADVSTEVAIRDAAASLRRQGRKLGERLRV